MHQSGIHVYIYIVEGYFTHLAELASQRKHDQSGGISQQRANPPSSLPFRKPTVAAQSCRGTLFRGNATENVPAF